MTHLVVYVMKKDVKGKSIDDIFSDEILSKLPTEEEVELIDEPNGYTMQVNLGWFPDRKELRVALANIDINLSREGIDNYMLWVGVNTLNMSGLFYKALNGEDVNSKIENELERVYSNELQKSRA